MTRDLCESLQIEQGEVWYGMHSLGKGDKHTTSQLYSSSGRFSVVCFCIVRPQQIRVAASAPRHATPLESDAESGYSIHKQGLKATS